MTNAYKVLKRYVCSLKTSTIFIQI